MKIITQQPVLRDAIDKVCAAVPDKSTLPQLETIRLESTLGKDEIGTLVLTGTDLQTVVRVTIAPTVVRSGQVNIPAHLLREWIDKQPVGEITATYDDKTRRVLMETAIGDTQMRTDETAQLPEIFQAVPESATTITLPAETLRRLIAKTLPFASRDELRPQMQGVNFLFTETEISATATDGHRLLNVTVPNPAPVANMAPKTFTVPNGAATALLRVFKAETGEITIRIWDVSETACHCTRFEFEATSAWGTTTIVQSHFEEEFPPWRNIVPTGTAENPARRLTLDRAQFLTRLDPLRWCANKNTPRVTIIRDEKRAAFGEVQVMVEDTDRGIAGSAYVHAESGDLAPKRGTSDMDPDAVHYSLPQITQLFETMETAAVTFVEHPAANRYTVRPTTFEEYDLMGGHIFALQMPLNVAKERPFRVTCQCGAERLLGRERCDACEAALLVELARQQAEREAEIAREKAEQEERERRLSAWKHSVYYYVSVGAAADAMLKQAKEEKRTMRKFGKRELDRIDSMILRQWESLPDRESMEFLIQSELTALRPVEIPAEAEAYEAVAA